MTDPVCPYCHIALRKIPQRKTKCKACGQYIFVRTHPANRAKIITTESGAKEIDILWQEYHENQKLLVFYENLQIRYKDYFEDEKSLMTIKFGAPPNPKDVIWSLMLKERLEQSKNREWGLFRNITFEMAELLIFENKHTAALPHLIDVCCLDLWLEDQLSKETGYEFSLSTALAPGVVKRLSDCVKSTSLDSETLNQEIQKRINKLPMLSRWRKNSHEKYKEILVAVENYTDD